MYTYLLLNFLTIIFPVLRSFEPKIYFAGKWKFLMPAIFITGLFFILWDHYFTEWEVWSFNVHYIMGIYIFSLPLEEWLFFITVPFACVFIYEVLKYFISGDPLKSYVPAITVSLIICFVCIAVVNYAKLYTAVCFSFAALGLTVHWLVYKKQYLGLFYITYLVHLIPFLVVNGLLTYLPVVQYNYAETLDLRIFTIPVEDTAYSFLLLLMNISFFEYFQNKSRGKHF